MIIIAVSHGITSIMLFLVVGLIISRTYSRYVESCSIVGRYVRRVLFMGVMGGNGIPVSVNFVGEWMCYVGLISVNVVCVVVYVVSSYVVMLYWVSVMNRKLYYGVCYQFSRSCYGVGVWMVVVSSILLLCYEYD